MGHISGNNLTAVDHCLMLKLNLNRSHSPLFSKTLSTMSFKSAAFKISYDDNVSSEFTSKQSVNSHAGSNLKSLLGYLIPNRRFTVHLFIFRGLTTGNPGSLFVSRTGFI